MIQTEQLLIASPPREYEALNGRMDYDDRRNEERYDLLPAATKDSESREKVEEVNAEMGFIKKRNEIKNPKNEREKEWGVW